MDRRNLLAVVPSLITARYLSPLIASAQQYREEEQIHVNWVSAVLSRMLLVKPGMTRAALLQVFKTEGGIFTGLHRRFVSQDCPFFKVDVDFRRAITSPPESQPSDFLNEYADDIIVQLSEPILQFSVMD